MGKETQLDSGKARHDGWLVWFERAEGACKGSPNYFDAAYRYSQATLGKYLPEV
jgi:hypothetical protein